MELIDATQKDIKFIGQVCRDAQVLYEPLMPGAFTRQAKRYEKNGLPKTYTIRILQHKGTKIGFIAQLRLNKTTDYIVGLYILSEFQCKQYGSIVLRKIFAEAKAKGIKEHVLLVHSKANWAYSFYEKNGFELIARDEKEAIEHLVEMKDYYIMNTYMMGYRLTEHI